MRSMSDDKNIELEYLWSVHNAMDNSDQQPMVVLDRAGDRAFVEVRRDDQRKLGALLLHSTSDFVNYLAGRGTIILQKRGQLFINCDSREQQWEWQVQLSKMNCAVRPEVDLIRI